MSVNQVNQTTGALSPIAGGTLYADMAVGTIVPYGGSTAPDGFLLCQGQSLLRTEYAELFAVIGTSFGSADSTTFNIPDLRGEFLRGAGTNSHSGQGDGGSVGQHQNATIIPNSGFATNSNNIRVYGYTSTNTVTTLATNFDKVLYPSTTGVETTTSSNLNRFAATNDVASGTVRPTNTSVNFIIKATTIALPSDFASSVDDAIDAKIVDTIADGNMKAVTSNAVYDYLNPTIYSNASVVSNNYYTIDFINFTKIGKQCNVIGHVTVKAANNGWVNTVQNIPKATIQVGAQNWAYLSMEPPANQSSDNQASLFIGIDKGGTNLKFAYGHTEKDYYFTFTYLLD